MQKSDAKSMKDAKLMQKSDAKSITDAKLMQKSDAKYITDAKQMQKSDAKSITDAKLMQKSDAKLMLIDAKSVLIDPFVYKTILLYANQRFQSNDRQILSNQ